jgi:hypothetical protein
MAYIKRVNDKKKHLNILRKAIKAEENLRQDIALLL